VAHANGRTGPDPGITLVVPFADQPLAAQAVIAANRTYVVDPKFPDGGSVLVIDDDDDTRHLVRIILEREGFDVAEARTADDALTRFREVQPDVVVLDLDLPDRPGLELLSDLRSLDRNVAVIVLSGAGGEEDRVRGLLGGADDYIVKPFSTREFAARAIAAARRRSDPAAQLLRDGDLELATTTRAVTVAGRVVDVTRLEFDLLHFLVGHPLHSFTRDQLLRAVWGSSAAWQSAATVTEHVRRLRAKLKSAHGTVPAIVAVRGVGYRLEPFTSGEVATASADSRAQASHDATVVIVGTTVVYTSPAALALVGATTEADVLGRNVFEFVAAQSVAATAARHESARAGRWPRPELITIRRLDGDELLVELASTPVSWEGRPASQVTLWEQKGDRSRLRELATGVRTDVSEAVIITGPDERIQSLNPAAEELYGWLEDEVVGELVNEVIPWAGDAKELHAARVALERDGRWHGESRQLRRDGAEVRALASNTVLRDAQGRTVGLVSVNRPIERSLPESRRTAGPSRLIDAEILTGIERDEFVVHFQPIVNLEDATPLGVEALVRWQHPNFGLLAPAAFIDAAEHADTIIELGQVVLEKACLQAEAWRRSGHDLYVAVNLSGRQLADERLPDRIARVMAATKTPTGKLWLEVTETSLVHDLEKATEVLQAVDELGVKISIDDFGTGWASLTYLHSFPVHALKIDKSFVQRLGDSRRSTTIVASIVSLGRELDLTVVPEGIETAHQRQHLQALGCRFGQGYLFSPPLAPDDLALPLLT
jgi:PAS domain S-box-containing protein